MARPTKASERTKQILEATIRTMSKCGYADTTLDRIAQESGLARGHVRHFVGNRQELIKAAAQYFYFDRESHEIVFPDTVQTVAEAIDYLFSEELIGPREENAVVFGFIEAARSDPEIAKVLLRSYQGAIAELADLLAKDFPQLDKNVARQIAFTVQGASIHNLFLLDISESADTTKLAKESAQLVVRQAVELCGEVSP